MCVMLFNFEPPQASQVFLGAAFSKVHFLQVQLDSDVTLGLIRGGCCFSVSSFGSRATLSEDIDLFGMYRTLSRSTIIGDLALDRELLPSSLVTVMRLGCVTVGDDLVDLLCCCDDDEHKSRIINKSKL